MKVDTVEELVNSLSRPIFVMRMAGAQILPHGYEARPGAQKRYDRAKLEIHNLVSEYAARDRMR